MFTGIIAGRGVFRGYRRGRTALLVEAPALAADLSPGDSLAVDGVCLTVAAKERAGVLFDLSRETLERTTLGALGPGAVLNLEPALTLQTPLGGHLVSGHVDAVGRVLRASARPPGKRLAVAFPAALRPYLVPKGSVAVSGVSLTVAALGPSSFEAELVPLTLEATNLGLLRAGSNVNLECDMIGKYVYNQLSQVRKTG
ncbi:MAG TPA: riboflavin synthase [Candidatus Aminicenantes bacterium]|nr:riboflavin synthase [Candidatus Aminicenantes bacterium]